MEFIRPFQNISKNDSNIAGGKGASLGEMTNAGIPVPPGFVILSSAFEYFIEKTHLNVEIDSILHKVNVDDINSVENASEEIKALIMGSDIPKYILDDITKAYKNLNCKYVAVRSSATAEDSSSAAWAGQLESYLNTTKNVLIENIKLCWASLFTPRAIVYRFEKNMHNENISVAVVIQKMVNSQESGIAFSVHPVTEDYNQLIIEAGFGLGEAIVSGQITPDSYVVEKSSRKIIDISISEQEKGLYKKEEGGNEWKDLGQKGKQQVLNESEILELSEIILNIEKHYGFPCDIEWAKEGSSFYIVQSRPITTLTYKKKEYENSEKLILGNQEVDASFLTVEMTWKGMLDSYIEKNVGIPMPKFYFEVVNGTKMNGYLFPSYTKRFVDSCANLVLNDHNLLNEIKIKTIETASKIRELAAEYIDKYDLLSDYELASLLIEIRKVQAECSKYGSIIAFADIFGDVTGKLTDLLNKRKLKYPTHVYSKVLGSPKKETLTEQAFNDITFSKEKESVLLRKYFWLNQGYIGRGLTIEEMNHVREEGRKVKDKLPQRSELEKELNLKNDEKRLFDITSDLIEIKSLRGDSRQFLHVLTNKIVDKLSAKWKIESKYVEALSAVEISEILLKKICIPSSIKERYIHCLISPEGESYKFEFGDVLNAFLKNRLYVEEIKYKNQIEGQVAYPGKVRGIVKLVFGPQHINKVKEGEILVSTATSPQLLPAMKKASAFITDIGGITSHAAIVSRELKKSCIVGTKIATQILKDGDLVEVDADKGIVKIVNRHTN